MVPVFVGDKPTCSTSPSTTVFKATALARQRQIVVPADWMFPVFLELLLTNVFFPVGHAVISWIYQL